MTEEEFDDEVEQTANLHNLTIPYAEYIVIKKLVGPELTFGLLQHLEHRNVLHTKEIKSLKLCIFDYYNNLKPGIVFAYNQEEAIAMIKEAGITGQPDKFYSSVKEIEIPTDPIYIRYATGE